MSLAFGFALPHWQAISGGFSPQSLFTGGVQGVLFDISDLTTLFTTSAGTTPVAMPGLGSAVSVGLMLDKSAPVAATGYYSGVFDGSGDWLSVASNAAFGYGTGDFTIEFWAYFSSISASTPNLIDQRVSGGTDVAPVIYLNNGTITYYTVGNNRITGSLLVAGQWYHIALARASGNTRLFVNGAQVGITYADSNNYINSPVRVFASTDSPPVAQAGYCSNLRIVKGAAVYTGSFTPPTTPLAAISGTSLLACQNNYFRDNSTNGFAITAVGNAAPNLLNPFDSTTARTVNNAIAFNDTTARPELRARVNLLERSEEFDNAYWNRTTSGVINAAGAAPNGTNTANKVYPSTTGTYRGFNKTITTTAIPYVATIFAKAAEKNIVGIVDFNGGAGAAWFNLSTGVASNVAPGYVAAITSAGNGWYQCSITGTAPAGTGYYQIFIADAAGGTTGTANGTDGVLLWGADLRPANIGANVPAYQRIADANTYDTSGFPLYLRFDGVDDSMYTPANLNLSGTDKVSVFAGVRKNDNTNAQAITELSAAANTNNGAFWVFTNLTAGGGASSAAYALATNGTAFAGAAATGTTAPITNVLSGALKISTSSDNAVLRVNGAQVATSGATSSGTGNFGTYPLYIGARNNNSVWLNGQIYSLIIAGSAVSAGNISATEQWVDQKTGLVIP